MYLWNVGANAEAWRKVLTTSATQFGNLLFQAVRTLVVSRLQLKIPKDTPSTPNGVLLRALEKEFSDEEKKQKSSFYILCARPTCHVYKWITKTPNSAIRKYFPTENVIESPSDDQVMVSTPSREQRISPCGSVEHRR